VVGEGVSGGAHVGEDGEDGGRAVEEEEEVAEGGDVADLWVGCCCFGAGVGCVVDVGWCDSGWLGGAAGGGAECGIDCREVNIVVEGQQCCDVPDVVFSCLAGVHWICDRDVFAARCSTLLFLR